MASIINASSSGSGGIVQTADASGVLQLQSNGSIGLSISGTTVTGTTSVNNQFKNPNASGNYGWTAGSQGAIFAPNSSPGLAAQFIVDSSGRGISVSTQDDNSTTLGCQLRLGMGASTGSTHGTINVNDNTTGLNGNLIISAKSVTMPLQPGFMAYTSNSAATFTAGTTILFDSTNFNAGLNYNGANGRFTAPVAGIYHFCRNQQSFGSSNQEVMFYKNGSQVNDTTSSFSVGNNGNNSSIYLSLAAGDYVTVYQYSGTSNGDYNNFSGVLVC